MSSSFHLLNAVLRVICAILLVLWIRATRCWPSPERLHQSSTPLGQFSTTIDIVLHRQAPRGGPCDPGVT